jgi:isochorismate synthase EntC
VAASLPEAELEETRLKLLAMQAALGADPAT